jgi:hypothetical protein
MRSVWTALALMGMLGGAAAAQQAPSAKPPASELRLLDVSLGRWVFHGTSKSRTGKTGTWTWRENCQWSPNRTYLECTFSNVWSGRPAESLVVDTYNTVDHAFWHYEMFSEGERGAKPFAAKMAVTPTTWIEYGGPHERITYHWGPAGHVKVAIETSKDGKTWTAVDQGEGVRQR